MTEFAKICSLLTSEEKEHFYDKHFREMKLCLLCQSSEEWPYTKQSWEIHKKFGHHSTLGKTWSPANNKHPDWNYHNSPTPNTI